MNQVNRNLFIPYANKIGVDQSVHPHWLAITIVVYCLSSIQGKVQSLYNTPQYNTAMLWLPNCLYHGILKRNYRKMTTSGFLQRNYRKITISGILQMNYRKVTMKWSFFMVIFLSFICKIPFHYNVL